MSGQRWQRICHLKPKWYVRASLEVSINRNGMTRQRWQRVCRQKQKWYVRASLEASVNRNGMPGQRWQRICHLKQKWYIRAAVAMVGQFNVINLKFSGPYSTKMIRRQILLCEGIYNRQKIIRELQSVVITKILILF